MAKSSKQKEPTGRKGYWVVEIGGKLNPAFRTQLPGYLTTGEISKILQRLASSRLTPQEVIGASLRKPKRTALLEARVDGPPQGLRTIIWIPAVSDYTATYIREGEVAEWPDIPVPA